MSIQSCTLVSDFDQLSCLSFVERLIHLHGAEGGGGGGGGCKLVEAGFQLEPEYFDYVVRLELLERFLQAMPPVVKRHRNAGMALLHYIKGHKPQAGQRRDCRTPADTSETCILLWRSGHPRLSTGGGSSLKSVGDEIAEPQLTRQRHRFT